MGKSPDDLPLDDRPLPSPPTQDIRTTEWYQFTQEIEEMIASGRYDWATDTLQGICESIEQYHNVTDGQRRAIENMQNARQRSDGWRRRRYDGFPRKGY